MPLYFHLSFAHCHNVAYHAHRRGSNAPIIFWPKRKLGQDSTLIPGKRAVPLNVTTPKRSFGANKDKYVSRAGSGIGRERAAGSQRTLSNSDTKGSALDLRNRQNRDAAVSNWVMFFLHLLKNRSHGNILNWWEKCTQHIRKQDVKLGLNVQ